MKTYLLSLIAVGLIAPAMAGAESTAEELNRYKVKCELDHLDPEAPWDVPIETLKTFHLVLEPSETEVVKEFSVGEFDLKVKFGMNRTYFQEQGSEEQTYTNGLSFGGFLKLGEVMAFTTHTDHDPMLRSEFGGFFKSAALLRADKGNDKFALSCMYVDEN